jgi:hypothetical protein
MRDHKLARALAIVLTLACIATVTAACTPGEPGETELQRMLSAFQGHCSLCGVIEQPSRKARRSSSRFTFCVLRFTIWR